MFEYLSNNHLGVLCLLCFILSYIFTRILMNIMINYKYGIDLHKKDKIKIPEMGGIAPVSLSALIISIFNPIISSVLFLYI